MKGRYWNSFVKEYMIKVLIRMIIIITIIKSNDNNNYNSNNINNDYCIDNNHNNTVDPVLSSTVLNGLLY